MTEMWHGTLLYLIRLLKTVQSISTQFHTWEVSSYTQGQAILNPEDHTMVSRDGARQGDWLSGHHHQILRLLGKPGRYPWKKTRDKVTALDHQKLHNGLILDRDLSNTSTASPRTPISTSCSYFGTLYGLTCVYQTPWYSSAGWRGGVGVATVRSFFLCPAERSHDDSSLAYLTTPCLCHMRYINIHRVLEPPHLPIMHWGVRR